MDITDRLLLNPEIWSQKPPETASEIEVKKFPGEHTPWVKSMSSIIFLASEKAFEVNPPPP